MDRGREGKAAQTSDNAGKWSQSGGDVSKETGDKDKVAGTGVGDKEAGKPLPKVPGQDMTVKEKWVDSPDAPKSEKGDDADKIADASKGAGKPLPAAPADSKDVITKKVTGQDTTVRDRWVPPPESSVRERWVDSPDVPRAEKGDNVDKIATTSKGAGDKDKEGDKNAGKPTEVKDVITKKVPGQDMTVKEKWVDSPDAPKSEKGDDADKIADASKGAGKPLPAAPADSKDVITKKVTGQDTTVRDRWVPPPDNSVKTKWVEGDDMIVKTKWVKPTYQVNKLQIAFLRIQNSF
eukprot:TRINITY_DN3236_c0_g2_i17.p3 TRINITY_DN3236_c0_g2~~TRINITY_DN3236_c0_g2_i17.p3  ORF type:complete len:293 (-),score=50.91 TRINITY_DN3236_c0_g2_i17:452-1330(-)